MRRSCVDRGLIVGLIAAVASTAAAQPRAGAGVVDGLVTDTNLVALANATVSILGSGVHVTTNANGRFRIVSLPSGSYLLVVHRLGYVPVSASLELGAADTLRTAFTLLQISNVLDTVVTTAKRLTARMEAFEQRRLGGLGTFMSQVDIEKRQPVVFSDLLHAIPSVRVSYPKVFKELAVSTRSGCALSVYVDDVLLPDPVNLADLPPPKELAGVEIYAGPSEVPLQYRSARSGCGVILVWTRSGS